MNGFIITMEVNEICKKRKYFAFDEESKNEMIDRFISYGNFIRISCLDLETNEIENFEPEEDIDKLCLDLYLKYNEKIVSCETIEEIYKSGLIVECNPNEGLKFYNGCKICYRHDFTLMSGYKVVSYEEI